MVIRCSSADRVYHCALSAQPIENPYNPESQAARDGTTHHECAQHAVAGTTPPFVEISAKYGTPVDDLRQVFSYACQAWEEVRDMFPNARTEVPLANEALRGTSDVVSIEANAVLDWKSGWSMSEHPYQLMAYASCLPAAQSGQGTALAIEVWLRHRKMRIHKFSFTELREFVWGIAKKIDDGGDATPGAHCTFCPRQLQCEERDKYVRSTANALVQLPPDELELPLMLGQLHDRAKQLRSALSRYDKLVRETIARDGSIPLPDGRRVVDAGREIDNIDPAKAWPVLNAWFDSNELAPAIKISKTKMLDAAKKQAARGEKMNRAKHLMADLHDAGAVTKERQSRLAVVDAEQE